MALLAEHVPKHRRKLVRLEGEPHIAGPLDDKILGLADFRDAGEVALDIGREYRHPGPREPFRHYLQRHGFTGSGSPGDEAMAIGQGQRQPGRLLALPDENFLVGIGHLVVGHSHRIASSRTPGVSAVTILHLASRLKPVNAPKGAAWPLCPSETGRANTLHRPKLASA